MTPVEASLVDRMLHDEQSAIAGKSVPLANCEFWQAKESEYRASSDYPGLKQYVARTKDHECQALAAQRAQNVADEPRRERAKAEQDKALAEGALAEITAATCSRSHQQTLARWLLTIRRGMLLKSPRGRQREAFVLLGQETWIGAGAAQSFPVELARGLDLEIFAYAWQPVSIAIEGNDDAFEPTPSPWMGREQLAYDLDGSGSYQAVDIPRPLFWDSRRLRARPDAPLRIAVVTSGCAMLVAFARVQ